MYRGKDSSQNASDNEREWSSGNGGRAPAAASSGSAPCRHQLVGRAQPGGSSGQTIADAGGYPAKSDGKLGDQSRCRHFGNKGHRRNWDVSPRYEMCRTCQNGR
ncbi:hypothetical protein BV898_19279 [Hypsibius exemplaris]|uniref:Uncharacterized protein n=1 Tax=Hypsibius exemplaris TaxID=2072580 RepID=A0A9X6NJ95_HYPEX|nr:hypothetical protein BV898_19279 [Hypsibius exemplaris]